MQDHSVSNWVADIKQGKHDAARHLWERYFPLVVVLARNKLRQTAVAAEDEEDVALSALKSFCLAAEQGRYQDLQDRHGLWKLLCRITHFKAIDLIRRNNVRHAGKAISIDCDTSQYNQRGFALAQHLAGPETTGEVAAMMADELRRLLGMLPDQQLKEIVIARMNGEDNRAIAQTQGCALRTVERRLQRIRSIWKDELPNSSIE